MTAPCGSRRDVAVQKSNKLLAWAWLPQRGLHKTKLKTHSLYNRIYKHCTQTVFSSTSLHENLCSDKRLHKATVFRVWKRTLSFFQNFKKFAIYVTLQSHFNSILSPPTAASKFLNSQLVFTHPQLLQENMVVTDSCIVIEPSHYHYFIGLITLIASTCT